MISVTCLNVYYACLQVTCAKISSHLIPQYWLPFWGQDSDLQSPHPILGFSPAWTSVDRPQPLLIPSSLFYCSSSPPSLLSLFSPLPHPHPHFSSARSPSPLFFPSFFFAFLLHSPLLTPPFSLPSPLVSPLLPSFFLSSSLFPFPHLHHLLSTRTSLKLSTLGFISWGLWILQSLWVSFQVCINPWNWSQHSGFMAMNVFCQGEVL